jgi:hypothetical protein
VANIAISTMEPAGSLIATGLSLLVPVLAFTTAALMAGWILWKMALSKEDPANKLDRAVSGRPFFQG